MSETLNRNRLRTIGTRAFLTLLLVSAAPSGLQAANAWIARIDNVAIEYHRGGIETTSDGGYLFYGAHTDGTGVTYPAITKFDAVGTPLWAYKYLTGKPHAIGKTSDGNYIVTAEDASEPVTWVGKIDPAGNVLAQVTFNQRFEFAEVVGNYCYLATEDGVAVTKIDLLNFADPVVWSMSASHNLYPMTVRGLDAAPNGGIYIVGWLSRTEDLKSFLMRVDPSGAVSVFRKLASTGTRNEKLRAVAATPDGGVVLAGDGRNWSDPNDDYDVWAVKLSSSWAITWQKWLGKKAVEWANNVAVLSDGSVLVGASSRSWNTQYAHDYWGIRFAVNNGAVRWQKRYWTAERDETYGLLAAPAADGGFFMSGAHTTFNNPVSGALLVKADVNGVVPAKNSAGETIPSPVVADTNATAYTPAGAPTSTNDLANLTYPGYSVSLATNPLVVVEPIAFTYDRLSN